MEINTETVARMQLVTVRTIEILKKRDTDAWLSYSREILELDPKLIVATLAAFLFHDYDSFTWAMYHLSINRGYEELLATFFIYLHQREK